MNVLTPTARAAVRRLAALAVALVLLLPTGCAARSGGGEAAKAAAGPETKEQKVITREEAIAIATKAIEGVVVPADDATIEVEERPDVFIVEWRRHITYPGPDYDALVTIDKATGKVLELLVG